MQVVLSVRAAPFWLKFLIMKLILKYAVPSENEAHKTSHISEMEYAKTKINNKISQALSEIIPIAERFDENLNATIVEQTIYVFNSKEIRIISEMIDAAMFSNDLQNVETCLKIVRDKLHINNEPKVDEIHQCVNCEKLVKESEKIDRIDEPGINTQVCPHCGGEGFYLSPLN
jgi:hypothetical protein